jgi:putative transposase
MEAYLHGVSTRKVDDVVKTLGIDSGIEVGGQPDLCRPGCRGGRVPRPVAGRHQLPVHVRRRRLLHARVNHRVVAQAV